LVTSVLSASHFIVFDNFLSEQERDSVWSYIQSEEFQFVHQKKWVKAFRLSDNEPLWGPPYLSDSYAPDTQNQVYPSGKGMQWNGQWTTTVQGEMSVCGCLPKSNQGA
jgi:hypothetical protein